ncbi:MAG TPA: oxaloacetate decarboxylase [Clostridiaceae bacterium]|nr:oxaloacetate decarboxylase [Clostridiaceae bacterium]
MNFENIGKGLIVSGYGLLGVFLVLILFYVAIRITMAISNKVTSRKNDEN